MKIKSKSRWYSGELRVLVEVRHIKNGFVVTEILRDEGRHASPVGSVVSYSEKYFVQKFNSCNK